MAVEALEANGLAAMAFGARGDDRFSSVPYVIAQRKDALVVF